MHIINIYEPFFYWLFATTCSFVVSLDLGKRIKFSFENPKILRSARTRTGTFYLPTTTSSLTKEFSIADFWIFFPTTGILISVLL